jgi:hypothetical protein
MFQEVSRISSKAVQPKERSSGSSSMSVKQLCLSRLLISAHRERGAGSLMRKRVKLVLLFKKDMRRILEKIKERLIYSLGLRCSLFLKRGRTEESSPPSKKSSRLAKGKNSAFPEII